MLTEDQTWDIISSYFKKYGFANHQLETFNNFILFEIQEIINNEPSLVINYKKGSTYTLTFGQVYAPSVSFIDQDRIIRNIAFRTNIKR